MLLVILAPASPATQSAARNGQAPAAAAASNFVSNDDGGQVEIVPAGLPARGPRKVHLTPVMKSVRQVSIFLGNGWADEKVRERERLLADLSGRDGMLDELTRSQVRVLQAPPPVDDFADLSGAPVNDLTLQQKLTAMLEHRTIPDPGRSTIYVVFLAPGVKSSIGGHAAGTEYAAYHNLLHTGSGEVRYVVVPYDENPERQAAAASRAFVDTAFNPNSD
jgi:hypothetical protein